MRKVLLNLPESFSSSHNESTKKKKKVSNLTFDTLEAFLFAVDVGLPEYPSTSTNNMYRHKMGKPKNAFRGG